MTRTPLDESLDRITATLKPYLEEHLPHELERIRAQHGRATTTVSVTVDSEEENALIRGLVPLDWREVLSGEMPPPEWLCEPILEAGKQVALFAEAKAGKSLLVLEAVCGIASGRAVLGNPAREPRSVVYADMENGLTDIAERVSRLGYDAEELAGLHYYSFPALDWLNTARGGAQLAALAERHEASLVVVDTLSRVVDGDENDAETYHAFYRHTGLPLKARGIALIRLDHAGKDASRGMRGSSAKTSDVDSVWSLTAEGEELTLTRTHTRNSHGADRVVLQRVEDPLRHEVSSGTISDPVTEAEAKLDLVGYPEGAPIKDAAKAIRAGGYKVASVTAQNAQKRRRARAEARAVGEMLSEESVDNPVDKRTAAPRYLPAGDASKTATETGTAETGYAGVSEDAEPEKPQVRGQNGAYPEGGVPGGTDQGTVKADHTYPDSATPKGCSTGTGTQTGGQEKPVTELYGGFQVLPEPESVQDGILRAAGLLDCQRDIE